MGRYFSPLLFLAAGVYVLWYNASSDARVLTLPFIDSIYAAAEGDLQLQGRITGIAFLTIGSLMLARVIYQSMQNTVDRR